MILLTIVGNGSILETQSNPLHKYLVLNQTRNCMHSVSILMVTFNRGKTGIVKRS